ncbi:very short patch repair endonuclease [Kangiella sp.]|uniref:very short patch repair endonuclease n=1 Tax=Kangiella sp. TaxID=1920245 RepID=UPI003A950521
MVDRLTKKQRSLNMALIKSKDTKPEIIVRKYLHTKGFRFRLHSNTLPGKPDIVLSKWKTVIFVNGCFWHRHKGCKYSYTPKSNTDFWLKKFKENVKRDQKNYDALYAQGWKIIIVWECEVKSDNFTKWLADRVIN